MAKKAKLPKDTNKKAKSVVDLATNDEPITPTEAKSIAAQLGRLGGLKGGPARKKALSAKRRKEIAQKAAAARWGHKK
jgi:hypothetical protein